MGINGFRIKAMPYSTPPSFSPISPCIKCALWGEPVHIEGQLAVYQYNTISASLHTMMIIYRENPTSKWLVWGSFKLAPITIIAIMSQHAGVRSSSILLFTNSGHHPPAHPHPGCRMSTARGGGWTYNTSTSASTSVFNRDKHIAGSLTVRLSLSSCIIRVLSL